MWRLTLICDGCGKEFGTDEPADTTLYQGVGQFARESYLIDASFVRSEALDCGWKKKGETMQCKACVKTATRYEQLMRKQA